MRIAYFFISYPGASQAFLQREVCALAAQGFRIDIYALWRKGDPSPDAVPDGCNLYGFPVTSWLGGILGFLRLVVTRPGLLIRGLSTGLRHLPTFAENWVHTFLGIGFALVHWNTFERRRYDHLHAAWATAPATAAAVLSQLVGVPYSFGAQAYDIYRQGGDAFLVPKMRTASFIHTTTQLNVEHLSRIAPESAGKIRLIRRGLLRLPIERDYGELRRPVRLLSVARLIPKKGHCYQVEAAAFLKAAGVPFELRWVGDGALREELEELIEKREVNDRIKICGHLSQPEVNILYQWADVFWHTGIIDEAGDRDGLPNVVPEAMAYGVNIVSSRVGAVTEAIADEVTGLLVDVTQPQELVQATRRLMDSVELRRTLASNARLWVEQNFLITHNAAAMAVCFRQGNA